MLHNIKVEDSLGNEKDLNDPAAKWVRKYPRQEVWLYSEIL